MIHGGVNDEYFFFSKEFIMNKAQLKVVIQNAVQNIESQHIDFAVESLVEVLEKFFTDDETQIQIAFSGKKKIEVEQPGNNIVILKVKE